MGRHAPRTGAAPLALALSALSFPGARALPGGETGSHWLQTHWQSGQGLPSNTVHAILQSQDGYIWIGTKRGLVRFDGVRFAVFNGSQLPGLSDSSVYALCETPDGALWIGGERGGVTRYHGGKFTPVQVRNQAVSRWVQAIQPGRHAGILIRTAGQMVAVKDGYTAVLLPNGGVPDNVVLGALEDRSGRLWLSTTKAGLLRFEDAALTRVTRFPAGTGSASQRVNQIYEDREGRVWLGLNGALARQSGDGFETFRFDRTSDFNEVHTIQQDLEGGIWAGVWGRAVRWKDGNFTEFPLKDGGADNEVLALAVDRENNIWAGTRNYGLYRLNAARLLTYTKREGLANNSVKSILSAKNGRLWVGSDAGLNFLYNGRFRVVGGAMSHENVRSLAEDRDGNLWIGGWNQVHRFRNGILESISLNQPGLPAQVATCLLPASDGSLWIGTRMGLVRLRDGVLTRITARDGLSSDFIRAVIEGRDGSIWAATSQGGLNRLKDGRITYLTMEDGLSSNDIYSLYEDREGSLWIGTMEHGLCRWKDSRIVCFTPADGLFHDGAYQIQEDGTNNLWIGGGGGIYRVSKSELAARAEGKIGKVSYAAFGESDGMPSAECRGGHQPASGKTPDGRLWFTTVRGLVAVDPGRLRTNLIPPPVVIEEVRVNGEALGASPEKPLGDGNVEFRYTGLSFAAPAKLRFKYRLSGFDRDWVSAGDRRVANYTNLPPGRYVFQVIAANNDGVWNETGASLTITLQPPFYRSHWFLALCAALAAGLALALHRYKLAVMEARFAAVLSERTRIAREMHDTIMQGMTGISAQLEAVSGVLADSPAMARIQIDRVRTQARAIVEEARRSIWNLRPKTLDGGNLPAALCTSARELTDGSAVRFQMELIGEHQPLPLHVERNLLRIAQEAIANAVQHGRPEAIRISLFFAADCVRLVVEDNGRGFDPSAFNGRESGHYGLIGMRERAEQMSGRLEVRSNRNAGTRIEAIVPRRECQRVKHAS